MLHVSLTQQKQGRIHGQSVVTTGWAGAAMQVGRGSMWVGGGCHVPGALGRSHDAKKPLFQPISRHSDFCVPDLPSFGPSDLQTKKVTKQNERGNL